MRARLYALAPTASATGGNSANTVIARCSMRAPAQNSMPNAVNITRLAVPMSGSSRIGTGEQRGNEQRRHHAAHERTHVGTDRRELRREEEYERELCDFRRLETQQAEAEPTPRAAGLQADVRDEREHEHQHRDAHERRRDALELGVVDAIRPVGEYAADREPDQLAFEKIRRIVIGVVCGCARRAENHHEADGDQTRHGRKDPRIRRRQHRSRTERLRRRAAGRARRPSVHSALRSRR